MYMYMYMYIYIYIYTHAYAYIYIYIYRYTYKPRVVQSIIIPELSIKRAFDSATRPAPVLSRDPNVQPLVRNVNRATVEPQVLRAHPQNFEVDIVL